MYKFISTHINKHKHLINLFAYDIANFMSYSKIVVKGNETNSYQINCKSYVQ